MPTRFYLAPLQLITRGSRQYTGPRTEIYFDGSQTSGNILIPDTRVKNFCLTWVDAPDELHAAIQEDATILALPALELNDTVASLSQAARDSVVAALEARRIPTAWIGLGTTFAEILRYILRCLDLTTRLRADYPEVDLDLRWDTLSIGQRGRLLSWAQASGYTVTGIVANTTLRAVLRRLIEDYPFGEIEI